MNEVQQIMSELQRHNDAILRGKSEIDKSQKKLNEIEQSVKKRRGLVSDLDKRIMEMKASIHTVETELKGVENSIEKISAKLFEASNQKEYEAGESEKKNAEEQKGALEEDVLMKMDDLVSLESEGLAFEDSEADFAAETKKESEVQKDRLNRYSASVKEHEDEFEKLLSELPQKHRSRFIKLSKSKDGKAIAELNGSACSGCNFSIPAVDLNSIRESEVISCTNCGRFVFEKIG